MAWSFADDFKTAVGLGLVDARGYGIRRNASTGGSNYGNSAAFDYFDDAASAGHYLYIACTVRYWAIRFYVGTPLIAESIEFAWEYCTGGDNWAPLVVDNPSAFLSPGEQTVSFTPPGGWGAVGSDRGGWAIRCRIVSVTGMSEGGANSTSIPTFNFKSLQGTGTETGLTTAYSADLAGAYPLLFAVPAGSLTPLQMPTSEIGESAQIEVVLAGTSAGAGATVSLFGTDIQGAALEESIDVSAGDGTYLSIGFFRDLTNVACAGFSDGTIAVTQKRWGILSQKTNQYNLKTHLLIGDGTTLTTVTLTALHLTFMPGMFWRVYNNASFRSGATTGEGTAWESSYGGCSFYEAINSILGMGGYWKRLWAGAEAILKGCSFFLSSGHNPTRVYQFDAGTLVLHDCHFRGTPGANNSWNIQYISPEIKRVYVSGYVPAIRYAYTTFLGLKTDSLVTFELSGQSTLTNLDGCSIAGARMWPYQNSRLDLVDCPGMNRASFAIGYNSANNDDCAFIMYRFDLTVRNAEAVGVDGVAVTIRDATGVVVFSGETDGDGQIEQQQLVYEKADWIGSPMGFLWEYRTPHMVSLSKTGYKTRTLQYTMDRKREEIEQMIAYREPVAAFTVGPQTNDLAVQFANGSDVDTEPGDTVTYSWSFGDGEKSDERNPVHEYAEAGTYEVSLTVTAPGGEDSLVQEIEIIPPAPPRVISAVGALISSNDPVAATVTREPTVAVRLRGIQRRLP